ncbi:putative serine/threonine-protein kinase iks1 [Tulasnella sp. 419]|nr:putative serine/threonine-protein kinase iks1 [Tulasnella sp. 419]
MDPQSSSPPLALISLPSFPDGWRPILEASNQVVLYNPSSHALSVTNSGHQGLSPSKSDEDGRSVNCPYCHRPLSEEPPLMFDRNHQQTRATNYFHLLAAANEISRPTTPITPSGEGRPLGSDVMAEGYFEAFFKEEKRLGMGANGSVWLCEHVLDGNHLGHYAVKKVAVGQSHAYLLNILREVRLLETLRHPNIITYHHSWLESFRFSPFGELVPTLFILMQWAEGGSLDDYIASRQGMTSGTVAPNDPKAEPSAEDFISRSDRIRAFREQKKARAESPEAKRSKPRETKAVHLLNADELRSLFQDVVTGLAFLHDRSILHLDLKPGNVLLTWDENRLIPRAMLSDFGTSQDSLNTARPRSGNTGTLEYTSPEALDASRSLDTKADMWSLGIHCLVI